MANFTLNATTMTSASTGGPLPDDWTEQNESDSIDDAIWILTATYVIFTMQTGFGLLEAGCVSPKNEVNIMAKNALDVLFGGISYWLLGFGFAFGDWKEANPFVGVGSFAVDVGEDVEKMGSTYLKYVFQLSFATTATTIVSGAMAERVKLPCYVAFASFNVLIYAFPAHWVWGDNGFLYSMGIVDIAGSGVVHLTGGTIGLIATLILKPRKDRYKRGPAPAPLGNGTNVIVGTFMLWWGWLGFNCGSTLGVAGGKWKVAAKAAICTLNASIAAGFIGVLISLLLNRKKFNIGDMVNAILGGLVAVTAPCAVIRPWEAIVIGAIGGIITLFGTRMFDRLHVDDPVGAISVHGLCGIWGLLSVGLFMNVDTVDGLNNGRIGLFHGGGWHSLGVQAAGVASIIAWAAVASSIVLVTMNCLVGLRMSEEEEELGADYCEHVLGPRALEDYYSDDKEDFLRVRRESLAPRGAFGTRAGIYPTLEEINEEFDGDHETEDDVREVRRRYSVNGSLKSDGKHVEFGGITNPGYENNKISISSQL